MSDDNRHDEFLRLFAKAQAVLRCYVYGHVPDSHHAEDILQEVALVLWKKFAEFRSGSNFSAWAVGVARNEVRHYYRSTARPHLLFVENLEEQFEAAVLESVPDADDKRTHLDECLGRLPQRMLDAVRMNYFSRMTVNRIAETRGWSVHAVRNLLYRARRALAMCMEQAARRRADGRIT